MRKLKCAYSVRSVAAAMDTLKLFFLSVFFLSTPVAVYCVYVLGHDKQQAAIANSYAFSLAMILLYTYPFLWPLPTTSIPLSQRVHKATMNWVIWLSVLTEIVFQIPHNLCTEQLQRVKGTALEWPFYSYGLSDSRWDNYHDGSGLVEEVWLINLNDAVLGFIVALCYYRYKSCKNDRKVSSSVIFGLVVLFRDATLWRETVEYMWDHHRKGYPYTTRDEVYRLHAIICLWLVNVIWLIAPCVSIIWVYNTITSLIDCGENTKKRL